MRVNYKLVRIVLSFVSLIFLSQVIFAQNTDNLKTECVTQQKVEELKPGFCCIGIVDTCMLKCQMCQKWKEDSGTVGIAQPTTEQWKTFIRQLRDLVDKDFEIDFGGGEALMRPDLLELVSYAKNLGFRNAIASNGYLINEDMAKRIVDSGLDNIVLSLDQSYKAEGCEVSNDLKGILEKYKNSKLEVSQHPFTDIAEGLGNIKIANMAALGCFLAKRKIIKLKSVSEVISDIAPEDKKALVEINKKALEEGSRLK